MVVVVVVVVVVVAATLAWHVRRASAEGAPPVQPLWFGGTLEESGVPVDDARDFVLRVFDAASGGTRVCGETVAAGAEVSSGRFRLPLADDCTDDVHDNPDLWVEVEVEGVVLGRTKMAAAPYALEADRAVGSGGALEARLAALEAAQDEAEDAAFCPRLVGQDRTRHVYAKDLATAGVVRCTYGADAMVKVGDFWIDRYEAVLVDETFWHGGACDGAGTVYASTGGASPTDNYAASSFPDTGNWSLPVYACSVSGAVPSRMMTWFQAQAACAASGKHLCTNAEWQAAVEGTYDAGAYDGTAGGSCHTNGGAPRATGMAGTVPGASASCISRWGAEDMIGNLFEWVADWGQAGPTRSGMTDGATATPWPSAYNADMTWSVNGRAHSGSAYTDGLPAAGLRGGASNHGAAAGAFSVLWSFGPSTWSTSVGARCCAGVP